jgi:hypothetical protein
MGDIEQKTAFERWLDGVRGRALGPLEGFYAGWDAGRASAQPEIDSLKNRIWDLERRWRSFDPWERAEEDAEDA